MLALSALSVWDALMIDGALFIEQSFCADSWLKHFCIIPLKLTTVLDFHTSLSAKELQARHLV